MKRMLILLLVAVPAFGQKTLGDGIKDLSTQLSASLTKEQKQRVAVLPFKELDGQTTVLGTYLAEELLSNLVNSGLKIVERGLLDKILSEQKLQQTGAIDPATAKQVGKVAGVDAIITGSVTDLQSNVGINARVIDTSTGEVFAAAQVKITKDDDVKKIMGIILKPRDGSTTTRTDDTPLPPQEPPKSRYWEGDGVRIVVDSFTRTGNAINATIAVENLRDQERTMYTVGEYYLLDENGEGWGGKLADGNSLAYINVPARSRIRTRWSFHPSTSSTGTVFTLVGGSNMTIRGLRPGQ